MVGGRLCQEHAKRLDPNIPFYYHRGSQRFYEGEMPNFSQPSMRKKVQRVARRELLAGNIGGRTSMAQRRGGSIRTTFRNVLVELPPPPSLTTVTVHLEEHAYCH